VGGGQGKWPGRPLLRIDPADTKGLVQQTHARSFETRGREMANWLQIGAIRQAPMMNTRSRSGGVTFA
jgi:hypothetical protein